MFHPEGPTFLELMRQALSSTERGYDLIAPKFDRTPFRTPDPVIDEMVREIGTVRAALDVCCGTGAAMRKLRACCKERVAGIDFSAGMLEEAGRRVREAPGAAEVELVRGDALALPSSWDGAFDVVTCVGAFGHIEVEDEDRFLQGIRRVLAPGGRFVFATGRMPKVTSQAWLMLRSFNAVMRVRNAVLKPPFIMYYLTFVWPDVRARLEKNGFSVVATEGACAPPYERAVVVVATRS